MEIQDYRFSGKTMASGTAFQTLREESTCSICLELMTDPVSIDCGHSYCRSCIMRSFRKRSLLSTCAWKSNCPVCMAEFQQDSIRPIKQLGNLINTVKKMEQERACEKHGEQLHLFCENDNQLICWRCERTPQHSGHVTVLLEDAYKVYKKKFQESLIELRKLEAKNKRWKINTKEKIQMWQSETMSKKKQIESDFKKFRMILHEEKKSCLWQLKNVEKDVLKRLQDRESKLEKQSQKLGNHILELEKKCQGPAQVLLQDGRNALNRISALKLNEPEDVSLDIHTMYNAYENCFKLRNNFETYEVIITLDSDTAHENVIVSENKYEVAWGHNITKYKNPVRFKDLSCVLGHQIFNSGSYFFKVFLLKGVEWDVGVCLENVPRDSGTREPKSGFWAIRCCKQSVYEALTSPPTPLYLKKEINFLGVFLNYEAGLVSFYDSDFLSHLYLPKGLLLWASESLFPDWSRFLFVPEWPKRLQ